MNSGSDMFMSTRHKRPLVQLTNEHINDRGPGMLVGYMRLSKADGSQSTDLQRDALMIAGVKPGSLYEDHASGKMDDRPHLAACLKALRKDDTLLVWKLDRLGRDLRHLVNTVHDPTEPTIAGLAAARTRGKSGGRPFKMTPAKIRLAMAAMGQKETKVGDLCRERGVTRQTLYRHVSSSGQLRSDGARVIAKRQA